MKVWLTEKLKYLLKIYPKTINYRIKTGKINWKYNCAIIQYKDKIIDKVINGK